MTEKNEDSNEIDYGFSDEVSNAIDLSCIYENKHWNALFMRKVLLREFKFMDDYEHHYETIDIWIGYYRKLFMNQLKELHNSKHYQDIREMQESNNPSNEQLIRWLN
jgi:hypothetical protein